MGVALVFLIGYNTIYKPQQGQLTAVRVEITAEQAKQQTQAEVATLLQSIDDYRKRLPSAPEPSWLVHTLVGLAEKSGVQLTTITQEFPQKADQFTRLSVNLQFTANYHQLGALLDEIERSSAFIRVDRLSLSKTSAAGGEEVPMVQMVCSSLYPHPVLGSGASSL